LSRAFAFHGVRSNPRADIPGSMLRIAPECRSENKVRTEPVTVRQRKYGVVENSFIILVDRIFTTFIEPLFTNVFDAIAQIAAASCLYPVCNGD
jgi:hypothetical protein